MVGEINGQSGGSIEIKEIDGALWVQFNGSCSEMLPHCRAICCRLRPMVNAPLSTIGEISKFRSKRNPNHKDQFVLQSEGGHCTYLTDSNQCEVHSDKPKVCAGWHCSPGGVDEDGKPYPNTGRGWALTPAVLWDLINEEP
tara:strand:- start:232 stop:654 length:423 start_codon:yes stop_codon:yes gene_type:complete